MKVPCSSTRTPLQDLDHASLRLLRRRRRRQLARRIRSSRVAWYDSAKPIGCASLLVQVRDEARRCAPGSARPSAPATGKPTPSSTAGIAAETFSLQILADDRGHHLLDRLRRSRRSAGRCRPRVATSNSARDARVALLVQRMAVAGDRLLARAPASRTTSARPRRGRRRLCARASISHEQASRGFRGAEDHRAAAEDAGRDRALHRVGRGRERHARRLHAGHEAVLGDRDQRRVRAPRLAARSAACR